jgi:PKD repeat protein
VATAFEENPSVAFETAGLYTATLEVETSGGCTYSTSQDLQVPAAPQAAFIADRTYGGTPLTVSFTNQSSGADTYAWDFGGAGSSTEASPSFTFDTPGTYTVSLTTETSLGCSDTFSETIEVVEPVTDLSLQNISLLSGEDDSQLRLLLILRNNGTLPLQDFPIRLTVDELLSIEERFEGVLQPGEQISYPLDFSLSGQRNRRSQLRYLCATLGVSGDVNLSDNRGCTSLEERLSVIAPYPNPAGESVEVSLVLPQSETVQLELISPRGELLRDWSFSDTRVGLNTFSLEVANLVAGSYLLRVAYRETSQTYRLMVGP